MKRNAILFITIFVMLLYVPSAAQTNEVGKDKELQGIKITITPDGTRKTEPLEGKLKIKSDDKLEFTPKEKEKPSTVVNKFYLALLANNFAEAKKYTALNVSSIPNKTIKKSILFDRDLIKYSISSEDILDEKANISVKLYLEDGSVAENKVSLMKQNYIWKITGIESKGDIKLKKIRERGGEVEYRMD